MSHFNDVSHRDAVPERPALDVSLSSPWEKRCRMEDDKSRMVGAYLHEAVENGRLTDDEAHSLVLIGEETISQESSPNRPPRVVPAPPNRIRPVPRLKADTRALMVLFSKPTPAQTLVRASRIYSILYGFAEALGSGFGSMDGIRYCIGTWDLDTRDRSSNFREFKNVVEALKEEAREGHLRTALIFLCTDNSTVVSALVKGNSTSPKLFELVLTVPRLEMHEGAKASFLMFPEKA
jgi:hypothetical protein